VRARRLCGAAVLRSRDFCQRALFATDTPTRWGDSCVTTGPSPLARMRRPVRMLKPFSPHHSDSDSYLVGMQR
jgi:hypothetical protein